MGSLTEQAASPYTFVDDDASLRGALRAIGAASTLGIDTEADSRHHYPEKVCLVQVGTGDRVYLIDSLAKIDLSPLGAALADPSKQKLLHGADFDLRGLNRDWGFEVRNLYDTNVAARFAGLERFGLAALIEDLLGLVIPKEQRLQRADWSRRPLAQDALDYAAGDVIHLPAVRDALDAKLAVGIGDRGVRMGDDENQRHHRRVDITAYGIRARLDEAVFGAVVHQQVGIHDHRAGLGVRHAHVMVDVLAVAESDWLPLAYDR